MKIIARIALGAASWLGLVTGLHLKLNVDWSSLANDSLPPDQRKLTVAYVPVT